MIATEALHAGPGTFAPGDLPPQCSLYLTTYTGHPGRANRGRVYLPFPTVACVTPAGEVNNVGQSGMISYGDLLKQSLVLTGASGGTCTLQYGIYSRTKHTIQPVVAYRTNLEVGSQVRRSFTRRANTLPF
jgi:hypothetical protein